MDRDDVVRRAGVEHADGFFRGAVIAAFAAVGTDRHDGKVNVAAAEGTEGVGVGSVAAEKDGFAAAFEEITDVAAIAVRFPACAPVFDFNGLDLKIA